MYFQTLTLVNLTRTFEKHVHKYTSIFGLDRHPINKQITLPIYYIMSAVYHGMDDCTAI